MLCQIIKKRSISTWKTLLEADALSCKIGEESITDFLILDLAKGAACGGYSVKAFTKHQEAVNGADWELWFTGPSGKWFGYRIQAKVIRISSLSYPHLHPPAAGGPTQANKLIAAAGTVSAVPIYVLYSSWPTVPAAPMWNCGTCSLDNRLWGLTAVPAPQIVALAAKNTLAALSPHMQPFHCLVCCGGYGGEDLPTRAYSFVSARIFKEAKLLEYAPPHVQQLLEREPSRQVTELEESGLPKDLGRLVVISQQR